MSVSNEEKPAPQIDWFVFLGGCGVLLTCIAPIVLAPEWSTAAIGSLFGFLTQSHGIVYVCTAIATLTFLLYIAISEHGNVVLGGTGSPAYSTFSWASMVFCADIGAALIYWGAAEWVFYYTSPPFNVESRSEQAILLASSYPIFHWGPVGWTFYSLPTIALGCSYHVYKVPSLCLSAACHAVLGAQTERLPGRTIDLLFIIGLLGTAATGLGLGTSVVEATVTSLTGFEDGLPMQIAIISTATMMIAYSVYQGLDKGIKRLSNINSTLALLFIAFVLIAGPTRFILEMGVASLGQYYRTSFGC